MRTRAIRKIVAIAMATLMVMNIVPIGLAQAKMVTTGQVLSRSTSLDDRAQVLNFLEREDVRQQLDSLGVDPKEAERRISTLSDEEVHQIAGRLDQLPAGQDAVIGPIVGAILIIFLVLLITDLVGLTDIFPFVHHKAK